MPTAVVPPVWEIPQVIRARLGDQVGRQRAMFHEGHLLLVLHAPAAPAIIVPDRPDDFTRLRLDPPSFHEPRKHPRDQLVEPRHQRAHEIQARRIGGAHDQRIAARLGDHRGAERGIGLALPRRRRPRPRAGYGGQATTR